MITAEKFAIYRKYSGDVDGWARVGTRTEQRAMSDQDWHKIEEMLQRLRLENSGLASEGYRARTEELLAKRVENEEVVRSLRKYA